MQQKFLLIGQITHSAWHGADSDMVPFRDPLPHPVWSVDVILSYTRIPLSEATVPKCLHMVTFDTRSGTQIISVDRSVVRHAMKTTRLLSSEFNFSALLTIIHIALSVSDSSLIVRRLRLTLDPIPPRSKS